MRFFVRCFAAGSLLALTGCAVFVAVDVVRNQWRQS